MKKSDSKPKSSTTINESNTPQHKRMAMGKPVNQTKKTKAPK
jgi:hypothetical protein